MVNNCDSLAIWLLSGCS